MYCFVWTSVLYDSNLDGERRKLMVSGRERELNENIMCVCVCVYCKFEKKKMREDTQRGVL